MAGGRATRERRRRFSAWIAASLARGASVTAPWVCLQAFFGPDDSDSGPRGELLRSWGCPEGLLRAYGCIW